MRPDATLAPEAFHIVGEVLDPVTFEGRADPRVARNLLQTAFHLEGPLDDVILPVRARGANRVQRAVQELVVAPDGLRPCRDARLLLMVESGISAPAKARISITVLPSEGERSAGWS